VTRAELSVPRVGPNSQSPYSAEEVGVSGEENTGEEAFLGCSGASFLCAWLAASSLAIPEGVDIKCNWPGKAITGSGIISGLGPSIQQKV